jgi:hypothetical protein
VLARYCTLDSVRQQAWRLIVNWKAAWEGETLREFIIFPYLYEKRGAPRTRIRNV